MLLKDVPPRSLDDIVDIFPLVHGPMDRKAFKDALRAQRRFDVIAGFTAGFVACAALYWIAG